MNGIRDIRLEISEDAHKTIDEVARIYPNTETGGGMYGIRSGDRIIVECATDPGRNPERISAGSVIDDIEDSQKYTDYYFHEHKLDYLGHWHKHPASFGAYPSGGDKQTCRDMLNSPSYFLEGILLSCICVVTEKLVLRAFLMYAGEGEFHETHYTIVASNVNMPPFSKVKEMLFGNRSPLIAEQINTDCSVVSREQAVKLTSSLPSDSDKLRKILIPSWPFLRELYMMCSLPPELVRMTDVRIAGTDIKKEYFKSKDYYLVRFICDQKRITMNILLRKIDLNPVKNVSIECQSSPTEIYKVSWGKDITLSKVVSLILSEYSDKAPAKDMRI